MRTSSPQSSGRRTVGLALLVAAWLASGLVVHAVVEDVSHASFLADLLTLVYGTVTAFMFFAARRRRQRRSSNV